MADSEKPTVLPSASEEPTDEERAPADTLIADGPEDYKGLAIVVLDTGHMYGLSFVARPPGALLH